MEIRKLTKLFDSVKSRFSIFKKSYMPFLFEKLEVYKKALAFNEEISVITDEFPKRRYQMLARSIILALFTAIIFNSNFVTLNAQIDTSVRNIANTEENISEEEIREFFRGIEATCNKMDAVSYVVTLSEDFKMISVVNNKKMEFSRVDCLKNLSYGWSLNKDYNYKFEILNMQLKGREAVIEGKESEKITLKTGEIFSGESIQKITLEKKKGQIKQKFIEAMVTGIR